MSMETPTHMREEERFGAWYHDPIVVEALVEMLEAKTAHSVTEKGEPQWFWKYSVDEIRDALFPERQTSHENPYTRAPIPTSGRSLASSIAWLQTRQNKFGPLIDPRLVERFVHVTQERRAGNIEGPEQRDSFWTMDKRIITLGLIKYCGLRGKDIAKLFSEKLERPFKSHRPIVTRVAEWKKRDNLKIEDAHYPLTGNSPELTFVEELRVTLGMSPQDLRNWMDENAEWQAGSSKDSRLEQLDGFIAEYEAFLRRSEGAENTEK